MNEEKKLSGLVCVRNGESLDYCWREAALSLMPVCDEVVICDSDSNDGTSEAIAAFAEKYPLVRVINYPWPNPHQNEFWWVEWLNWAREQLRYPYMIQLDADEVLDDRSLPTVRRVLDECAAALFKRLNFWNDASHTAPHNTVCGTMVARMGPTRHYLPSDEPNPRVSPNLRTYAQDFQDLYIFHYGFIRHPSAFVKKSDVVQNAFFGSVDPRMKEMEDRGMKWNDREYGFTPDPYSGHHPAVAHDWLKARGHTP